MRALEEKGLEVILHGQAAHEWLAAGEISSCRRSALIVHGSLRKALSVLQEDREGEVVSVDKRTLLWTPTEGPRREGVPASIRVQTARERVPPTPWFSERNFKGLERDLATREVTMDALGIRSTGEILDPFGGVQDFFAGRLCSVVPVRRAFQENGLWALKLAQFIGERGLPVPAEVTRFGQQHAGRLMDVPVSRWKKPLDRLILSPHVDEGLEFLYQTGALQIISPEVVAMVDFHTSCPIHHKDLWDHTKQVVAKAEPNLAVRWAALMHDIGKIATRTVTGERKVHFFRHEELGGMLFRGVAARLELAPSFAEQVDYIIRNHSRVNLYDSTWTDSAVRRMLKEVGDYLPYLLMFSKADFTTKRKSKADELRRQLAELEERIARIQAEDAKQPALPKGLGKILMATFEIPPGRELGDLMNWLREAVEEGSVEAQVNGEIYIQYIRQHPDRLQAAGGQLPA